ncbi:hypothetical protein OG598_05030 [Micromonospora sp. NBC_00330]|uniref:hypothetical protein n=1 Tax=Micromonospora sp. NBC_00330 TaxID=2903585 RepID=UPI002E2C33E6|nr:hypothetical protein [Micromonospora sp. NBC_00330]
MGSLGLQAALAHAFRADQCNAGGPAPVGRRGDAPQLCVPASEYISDAIPDGYLGGFHRPTVLLAAIDRLSSSHHAKGAPSVPEAGAVLSIERGPCVSERRMG